MLSDYGWSPSCGCFKLKNYLHVIILTSLFPNYCTIDFTVPTCFDCKLQPYSVWHKCRSDVQLAIQFVKHEGIKTFICISVIPEIYSIINFYYNFNPLNAELNPICHLLALLGVHFLHVSRIRVKSLTLRLLMSYIYIYIYVCMYVWSTHS